MSVTQHESKRRVKARVLSLDVSSAEEPKRSRARSRTVLKSPHKTAGIERSTASEILLKNRSLAGLRLGAYRQSTRKVASWKEKLSPKVKPKRARTQWIGYPTQQSNNRNLFGKEAPRKNTEETKALKTSQNWRTYHEEETENPTKVVGPPAILRVSV